MGLLDRLRGTRKKGPALQSGSLLSALPSTTGEMMGIAIEPDKALRKAKIPNWYLQHPYGRPRLDDIQTLRTLAQMGIVQRCINLVLDQVLSMPWDILPIPGEELTPELEQIAQNIRQFLGAANTNERRYFDELRPCLTDFLEIGEGLLVKMFDRVSYVHVGGQYVVPQGTPAKLLGIQAHDASQFYVFQDDHGQVFGHWQFTFRGGDPVFFSPRELIVFRDQPTTYYVYGRSRIKQIQDMLEWVFSQIQQTRQYYKSGAIFQGFLKTSGLSKKEEEALEKYVMQVFAKQKHKMGVFHGGKEGDVSFERLMLDVKDLAFLEGLDFVQKFVMSLFGVTPAELGITDAVNKASAEQQTEVFQRRYRVLLNLIEYRTNTEVVRELDPTGKLEFKYIFDADPAVRKLEQDIAESQLKGGQITVNEWRQQQGLDPVPWGDVPYFMQKAPQDPPPESSGEYPGDSPEQDSGDEDDDEEDLEDQKKSLPHGTTPTEYVDLSFDIDALAKGISDAVRDSRLARLFNPVIRSVFNGLKSVLRAWRRLLNGRLQDVDAVTSTGQIDQMLDVLQVEDVADEIREGVQKAYEMGLRMDDDIRLTYDLNIVDPRAIEYIREYPLIISRKLRDDVAHTLKRELYDGVLKGESVPNLQSRVREVLSGTESRAETIARTEVINASAWGKVNQIRAAGGTRWQFYATEDERTCPICVELHTKIFPMSDLQHKPPVHPNCRCTILTVDGLEPIQPFAVTPKMASAELTHDNSLESLLTGDSIREVARRIGVSRQTVSNWRTKLGID